MEKIRDDEQAIVYQDEYIPFFQYHTSSQYLIAIGLGLIMFGFNQALSIVLVGNVALVIIGLILVIKSWNSEQQTKQQIERNLLTKRTFTFDKLEHTLEFKKTGHIKSIDYYDLHDLKKIEIKKVFLSDWYLLFIFNSEVLKIEYLAKETDCIEIRDAIRSVLRDNTA